MLFRKLFSILLCVIAIFILASCNKGENPYPQNPNRFVWTYKNANYTAYQQMAFTYSRGLPYVIIGVQGNTLTSFPRCEFSLTSFNQGNYSFSTGANIFKYYDASGNILEASSGGIQITAKGDSLMSGSFSATLVTSSGSANVPISGNFTNMPIEP